MKADLLDRRAVVARLLVHRKDAVVVSGLGAPTYDVAAAGDHPRNFYLWGAMGGAAMIGLGLALAQPEIPVIVVTGDGEMLMGLGAFATIAVQAPPNLTIVVLDNGVYGETGRQASHTQVADLAAIARASGIAEALVVRNDEELAGVVTRAHRIVGGPAVAVVKIDPAEPPRVLPLREGAYNKARFRLELGLPME
jgi:thiamine pyrophosphate-dependent acetolactate synthase large subunit-like protein